MTTANETIESLQGKLLEAYRTHYEASEAIKTLSFGLQGVQLGKAAAGEAQKASLAAAAADAEGRQEG
jgi:hypothetical protein